MAKHSGAQLDLTAFSSPEELMSLGLDRLKSALMALGLKCGGYDIHQSKGYSVGCQMCQKHLQVLHICLYIPL